MTEELKTSITNWFNSEWDSYLSECGSQSEARNYIMEDAVGKFASFDEKDKDLAEEVVEHIAVLIINS